MTPTVTRPDKTEELPEKKAAPAAQPETPPAGRKKPGLRRLRGRIYSGMRARAALFFLILAAGCAVSFMLPLRPRESAVEKRRLAEFPRFSFASLASGDYFAGVSTWYADTFPGREKLIKLNNAVREIYVTKQTVQIHGSVQAGDDIPDAPETPLEQPKPTEPADSAPASSGAEPANGTESAPSSSEASSGASSSEASSGASSSAPEPASPPKIAATGDTQAFSAVLLAGDSAYEYYNFEKGAASTYIGAVSKAGDGLAGYSKVYAMIPPTSIGITLPDSLKDSVNSSDQEKAITYMFGSMSRNVRAVDPYAALMQHRNEYIYFRTDHHWTALGAWYAYGDYCRAAGLAQAKLTDFKEMSFPGFLGSFYSSTNESSALSARPDTVTAYRPADTTMTVTDKNGQVFKWPVVSDVSDVAPSLKYGTFIAGDNPFTVIANNALQSGGTAVVVKESFGNAMIPFLTANYKTVYVIDYRYWKGSVVDFAKKNGINDVLFINNISATRSDMLMSYLAGVI